jgi:ribonuclease P protein component
VSGQNAGNRLTLRAHSEFQRVFAARTRFFRNGLGFCFRKDSDSEFRYGISIPKRFGKAVERNKVRRRLKEVIRRSALLPLAAQVVVCISKPCDLLSFDLIKSTCEWAFVKISNAKIKSEPDQQ